MACNFTISANETSHEFDWIGGQYTFNVIVDGSTDNNSYYIENEYSYDWFTIERNRNILIVRVDPYFEYDNGLDEDAGGNPRTGYIRLVHNCNDTATVDINITQRGVNYNVSTNTEKVTLPPLEDSETPIYVTTYGGSEKFYVKSVKEYSNHTINIGTTEDPIKESVEIDYDNAFKFSVENNVDGNSYNGILTISTYGRPFVDEGCFYEITLAHRDYRFATCAIKVYFEEPSEKNISVSPSNINFDYHGIVTDDDGINYSTITLTCDGDEIPDYGYTYTLNTDADWLTITGNPTSLSFDCEQNCETTSRTAIVTVYEYTDEEKGKYATITITQDVNENCSIVPSQSVITVPSDASGETYQTTFKVYGITKTYNDVDSANETKKTLPDWISVNFYKTGTEECLYTQYNLDFTINSDNNSENRSATITLVHNDDSDANATITVIQSGTIQSEDGITQPLIYNNTITVTLNPATDNPQVSILTTGSWCKASVTETHYDDQTEITTVAITVTCDDNHWDTSRTCRLTLSNANNPNNELYFLVTQKVEGGIEITQ